MKPQPPFLPLLLKAGLSTSIVWNQAVPYDLKQHGREDIDENKRQKAILEKQFYKLFHAL